MRGHVRGRPTLVHGQAERQAAASPALRRGFAFYLKEGRLHYGLNYVARDFFGVRSAGVVPEGRHALRFEFEPTGKPDFPAGNGGAPGRFQLYMDGTLADAAEVPHTTPMIYELEGLSCAATSVSGAADPAGLRPWGRCRASRAV